MIVINIHCFELYLYLCEICEEPCQLTEIVLYNLNIYKETEIIKEPNFQFCCSFLFLKLKS
jgi:hypothetical protein